jgi:hypothetical protein
VKRGVIPWLLPLVMLLALLVAVTNSPIVYGAVLVIGSGVLLPPAMAAMRRGGNWSRSLGGSSDPNRRRFWGM